MLLTLGRHEATEANQARAVESRGHRVCPRVVGRGRGCFANGVGGFSLRTIRISGSAWRKPTSGLSEGLTGTGSERVVPAAAAADKKRSSKSATNVWTGGRTGTSAGRSG